MLKLNFKRGMGEGEWEKGRRVSIKVRGESLNKDKGLRSGMTGKLRTVQCP